MAILGRRLLSVLLLVIATANSALASDWSNYWGRIMLIKDSLGSDEPYAVYYIPPYSSGTSNVSVSFGWEVISQPDPSRNMANALNAPTETGQSLTHNIPVSTNGPNPIVSSGAWWTGTASTRFDGSMPPRSWPQSQYNTKGYFRIRAYAKRSDLPVYSYSSPIFAFNENGIWRYDPFSTEPQWSGLYGGEYGTDEENAEGKLVITFKRAGYMIADGVLVSLRRNDGQRVETYTVNGMVNFGTINSGPYKVELSGTVTEGGSTVVYSGGYDIEKPAGEYRITINVAVNGHLQNTDDEVTGGDSAPPSWLESLLVPSEESINSVKGSGYEILTWGPFGLAYQLLTTDFENRGLPLGATGAMIADHHPFQGLVIPSFGVLGMQHNPAYLCQGGDTWMLWDDLPCLSYDTSPAGGLESGIAPAYKVDFLWLTDNNYWPVVRFIMGCSIYAGFFMFMFKKLIPQSVW